MQQKVAILNESSDQVIKVGMGMHAGPLIMGIIGDEQRNDPATISDTVNAASRMENLTKHYGANIIITEHCLKSLINPGKFHFRYLGKVQVKGKKEALGAYECFDGDPSSVRELKIGSMDLFNQAMECFYHREFAQATALFDQILRADARDLVAKYFRNRSAQFTVSGVPENWDGVEKLTSK